MTSDSPTDETGVEPPETFAALADPTRLRAVRTVAESAEPPSFTELFEASDADTTAGFAYHLRQLTGRYLRKADERYHLTYAGRRLARALDAGTFTDRVDRDPESVAGDCPICGESALAAGVADSVVAVACGACETELLALPFTPNGVADRPTEEVLRAFDSYHRARLSMVADGVCPDCAGAAASRIELRDHPAVPTDDPRPVADCGCEDCGFRLRVPVSLLLLDHPAVRRFAADAGIAVEERPIWNLGPEWAERVVSDDPPAVAVSITADGERVELLVGDGPTVP
ncbi:MAG: ArsR family transcriptional regulator, partial [Halobaculum sp.]